MVWALGAYFLVSLGIGLWGRKRTRATIEGYFAAGRQMPWYLAALSMVATTFAVDTPLAITEYVRQGGLAANWRWWNMLIGGMLSVVVFAPLWRRSGVLTDSEILSLRYGGEAAAILRAIRAVWLGVFINLIILGWVQSAMLTVLRAFVGLSLKQAYIFLSVSTGITLLYTLWGGLWSVVWTDVLQLTLALGATTLLMVRVLMQVDMTAVPAEAWSLVPGGGEWNWAMAIAFLGLQWWASWYPGAEPGGGGYILQRMASTPSPTSAQKALALFQVLHYAVRPITWYSVALASLIVLPQVEDPREAYLLMAKKFLSPPEQILLLVGLAGAYMSTLSTHFNWGASYIARDLGLDEKKGFQAGLWATLVLALLSVGVTPFMTSIAGAWNFLIESGAGTGLVLLLRWFWRRITILSEIAALIAPMIGYGIFRWGWRMEFPYSYIATVGFTAAIVLLTAFLGRGTPPQRWQTFIEQVRPQVQAKLLLLWLWGVGSGYAVLLGSLLSLQGGTISWLLIGGVGGIALFFFLLRNRNE
ncbi:MAG: sodium:proline symporter [Bacteroidia bacterium]|nr:sodium:proline symporter [Bacteroidia bacterium]MDW8235302.1 sodium:proline symporter [Bacteroidia bacterium]